MTVCCPAPLIGALVAATGELPLEAVAEVVADRDAMFRGAERYKLLDFRPRATADSPAADSPTAG